MPTGTIKKKMDKGFGFISVEGSPDVFFHFSSCQEVPFEDLREGQTVQFEMGQGPKGPKADNVRPVTSASPKGSADAAPSEAEYNLAA